MPKVTMDVPEGFEDVVQHLEKALQRAQKGVDGAQAGDMAAFDAAWQSVNADVEEAEQQMKRRLLRATDLDAPQILIDSKPYARVGRYAATYKTRRNRSPVGACLKGLPGSGRWAGRRSTVVAAT